MRKSESFRGPGKVPGRVLRKPGKIGGPEKFRVGQDIFDIHLLCISKRFGINLMNLISMGSLSLGRPKWGGSIWAKGGPRVECAWGSFQEASPSPLAQP